MKSSGRRKVARSTNETSNSRVGNRDTFARSPKYSASLNGDDSSNSYGYYSGYSNESYSDLDIPLSSRFGDELPSINFESELDTNKFSRNIKKEPPEIVSNDIIMPIFRFDTPQPEYSKKQHNYTNEIKKSKPFETERKANRHKKAPTLVDKTKTTTINTDSEMDFYPKTTKKQLPRPPELLFDVETPMNKSQRKSHEKIKKNGSKSEKRRKPPPLLDKNIGETVREAAKLPPTPLQKAAEEYRRQAILEAERQKQREEEEKRRKEVAASQALLIQQKKNKRKFKYTDKLERPRTQEGIINPTSPKGESILKKAPLRANTNSALVRRMAELRKDSTSTSEEKVDLEIAAPVVAEIVRLSDSPQSSQTTFATLSTRTAEAPQYVAPPLLSTESLSSVQPVKTVKKKKTTKRRKKKSNPVIIFTPKEISSTYEYESTTDTNQEEQQQHLIPPSSARSQRIAKPRFEIDLDSNSSEPKSDTKVSIPSYTPAPIIDSSSVASAANTPMRLDLPSDDSNASSSDRSINETAKQFSEKLKSNDAVNRLMEGSSTSPGYDSFFHESSNDDDRKADDSPFKFQLPDDGDKEPFIVNPPAGLLALPQIVSVSDSTTDEHNQIRSTERIEMTDETLNATSNSDLFDSPRQSSSTIEEEEKHSSSILQEPQPILQKSQPIPNINQPKSPVLRPTHSDGQLPVITPTPSSIPPTPAPSSIPPPAATLEDQKVSKKSPQSLLTPLPFIPTPASTPKPQVVEAKQEPFIVTVKPPRTESKRLKHAVTDEVISPAVREKEKEVPPPSRTKKRRSSKVKTSEGGDLPGKSSSASGENTDEVISKAVPETRRTKHTKRNSGRAVRTMEGNETKVDLDNLLAGFKQMKARKEEERKAEEQKKLEEERKKKEEEEKRKQEEEEAALRQAEELRKKMEEIIREETEISKVSPVKSHTEEVVNNNQQKKEEMIIEEEIRKPEKEETIKAEKVEATESKTPTPLSSPVKPKQEVEPSHPKPASIQLRKKPHSDNKDHAMTLEEEFDTPQTIERAYNGQQGHVTFDGNQKLDTAEPPKRRIKKSPKRVRKEPEVIFQPAPEPKQYPTPQRPEPLDTVGSTRTLDDELNIFDVYQYSETIPTRTKASLGFAPEGLTKSPYYNLKTPVPGWFNFQVGSIPDVDDAEFERKAASKYDLSHLVSEIRKE